MAAVEFPVSFAASAAGLDDAVRAQIVAHVQAAGQRWVQELQIDGDRSIEIEIALDPAIPTANGGSLTTSFVGVVGSRNMFEPGMAAELKSGTDPNGATPDARITLGTAYLADELWFDPDPALRSAAVPANRTDAMSVFMHEIGHALAYNGWADGDGVPPAEFFSPFDRWMISGAPPRFDGPLSKAVWGSRPDLTHGNVMHWGNGPVPTARQQARREPVEWQDGRPLPVPACGGLHPADAPPSGDARAKGAAPSLIDELMNGVVYYRGRRYDISALDVALLADVGLPIASDRLFDDGFESD